MTLNYVFTATNDDLKAIFDYYRDFLVSQDQTHILYLFRCPGLSVTIFRSLKVLLQGENALDDYLMWSEIIGFTPEKITPVDNKPVEHRRKAYVELSTIGSDEVGTGDFFGPVVVVAAHVPQTRIPELIRLGVRDSKKLTDDKIEAIAPELISTINHVTLITPNAKYNELVQKGFNLNKIKSYLHNHAILKLQARNPGKIDATVIDQFCSPKAYFEYLEGMDVYKDITFVEKAEDSYISVAAASIIARNAFLREMAKLSTSTGIVLPLGAGPAVDLIGKRIALEKGFGIFNEIAKTNFKNLDKIKGMM